MQGVDSRSDRLGDNFGSGARTRYFKAPDGVRLVADDLGSVSGPVVILLHGGGQTRHSWAGAMRVLAARGYRVINFDARGHGDSDWSATGSYELDDRAEDLQTIVATLEHPFALVGASLGGSTAIHAVAGGMTPAAVILVDIVPHPEPLGVDRIVKFMKASPDGFSSLDEAADAVSSYNPDRPRPRDPSGLMRNLRRRENGRLYWHWDPATIDTDLDRHQKVMQRSAAIMAKRESIPTLLVHGLKSDVVSQTGVAAFRRLLPSLEVTSVGGAGHMVAGDRNDAFNTAVIEFLIHHLPPNEGLKCV